MIPKIQVAIRSGGQFDHIIEPFPLPHWAGLEWNNSNARQKVADSLEYTSLRY
jgi:hypothetical protein